MGVTARGHPGAPQGSVAAEPLCLQALQALRGQSWWQQLPEPEQTELTCVVMSRGAPYYEQRPPALGSDASQAAMAALGVPRQCRHMLLASVPAAKAILRRVALAPSWLMKAKLWIELWELQAAHVQWGRG